MHSMKVDYAIGWRCKTIVLALMTVLVGVTMTPALLAMPIVVSAESAPRFVAAKPVWPKWIALERNLFVGFAAHFDAKEGERPLLRITGASDYRIWLNGEHVGWGPARAAKGYFRVDEIPLQVKAGQNILAVEVAGYNVNSFCTMCQPPFLQAEVVLGDKVIVATGVDGGFSAWLLPRVQKVVRSSYQRAFSELYRLRPNFDDWKRMLVRTGPGPMLEERPEVKLLPRRAPYAEFKVRGPFRPVSRAKTVFDAKRRTRPVRFVDGIGPDGVGAAFARGELEENWWDLSQRYVATNRTPWKDDAVAGRIALADGDSVIFDAGLNDSGFPMLRVKCLRPGKIAFRFDEVLVNGEVSPTRYECANVVVWDLLEPDEYALEAFEPYTLRYADVVACSGAFEIDPPSLREYKNPEAFRATLESSDKALEKIFAAAQETFSQNSADVFTDCPGRAKTGKFPQIHPSNAFIGNYLRLECLAREGLSAQILEETRGFFLYMAELTGTLWEHIRTEASCNHGFASHIAVTCRRDLLGLRKMDYAAKTLVFDPPRDLPVESLSMTLPVGGGEFVRAGWRNTPSGELVEELSLPPGWRRLGE